MDSDAGISSAPYGHACANCARAKCKCVNWNSGRGCERCRRLSKDCRPASRVRKPKPLSRTAQLERTVNQLVSLLKTGDQGSPGPAALPGVSRPASGEHTPPPTANGGSVPTLLDSPALNRPHINVNEQDELLASFRATKLRYFPFIHIPSKVKGKDFKNEYPCLWHCITIIESKSAAQSLALSKQFGDMVGRALLVNNEKSLDLLYGLLAYLAWITYHCPSRKSSLGMYTQLAIGLVFELGLNKAPPLDSSAALAHCSAMAYNPRFKPTVANVRTMNQRRAVLCCFLISSCISQFLGRTNTLQWTSHMSECLDVLAESNETPNDIVLVQLVSFWLLVDKMSQGPWTPYTDHAGDKQINRAPIDFHINAFESQLIELINKVPAEMHDNQPVRLHCLHTRICLYEIAIQPPNKSSEGSTITQLDHLYTCLQAVKEFFDLLLSSPPATFISLPLPILVQISHTLNSLFRLSILDCPGWDKTVVRSTVDLLSIAERLAVQLGQVAQSAGIDNAGSDDDSFSISARDMLKLRAAWASRMADSGQPATETVERPSIPNTEMGYMDNFLAWPESIWFTDPLVPGPLSGL